MPSHHYEFTSRDVLKLLGSLLVPTLLFAAGLHTGARLKLWPRPRPTATMEQTIIVHQTEAAMSARDVDLVLLGDSSCLMDVNAAQLESLLPTGRVLNLGTLSYLDLRASAELLSRAAAASPQLRFVVVLLHPQTLRGVDPVRQYSDLLQAFAAARDFCDPSTIHGRLECWLGLSVLRGRFLDRAIPAPLPGRFGQFYGFTADLERFMAGRNGSAVDPHRYSPGPGQGSAEYRLAASLEPASRAFRARVPAQARMFVGLTPIPMSHALRQHDARYRDLLAEWSRWMQADAALNELPATLPDDQFASVTHLNESGSAEFTRRLAEHLSALLVDTAKLAPR